MDFIHEAKKIAGSNGRACREDIDLLVQVLKEMPNSPVIVKLGANSAFTIAILAVRPLSSLWLIEDDAQGLNWELKALQNYGFDPEKHRRQIGLASKIGEAYKGPKIALLILDLSFGYAGVMADLKAWVPHLKPDALVFVHDYDGTTAPASYPDIADAVKDYFKRGYLMKGGWSAVWSMEVNRKKVVAEKPVRGNR